MLTDTLKGLARRTVHVPALASVAFVGCGGGGGDGGGVTPPIPKTVSVSCTPSATTVTQGQTYTVHAVATGNATITGTAVTVDGSPVGSSTSSDYTTPAIPASALGTRSISCTATSPDATTNTPGSASVTVTAAPIPARFEFYNLVYNQATNTVSAVARTLADKLPIDNDPLVAVGGVATKSLTPGTHTIGLSLDDPSSPTYAVNRIEANGQVYFTWDRTNAADAKTSVQVPIDAQTGTVKVYVYQVNGNNLTNKFERYRRIYGDNKDQNGYPGAVGAHRMTTQGMTLVKFYGADAVANCAASNAVGTTVIDSVAKQIKAEEDDALNGITHTITSATDVTPYYTPVTINGITHAEANKGYQIMCTTASAVNQPTNLTTFDATGTPIGSIARFSRTGASPTPNSQHYGTGLNETREMHAGAFSEDKSNEGGFWDELRATNNYSPDELEAQAVVGRYFARPIQKQLQATGVNYKNQVRFALTKRI